jgi:hypothetical protein
LLFAQRAGCDVSHRGEAGGRQQLKFDLAVERSNRLWFGVPRLRGSIGGHALTA